jgi:hypothetical protein
MEFNVLNLSLAVLFGAIGFGYFIYGKRQRQGPALIAGLLLMLYPYVIYGTWSLIAVGLILMAAPFVAKRMGW